MPQSLTNILVHTIFSTKDRQPFLRDRSLRNELHHYLGGILTNYSCPPIVIGGVDDHVHLLHTLSRTGEPAALIKELKRCSTVWLKTKNAMNDFMWQGGYGMFSIGVSQIDATRRYINGQEEHHRKVTFQDELRQFLQRHKMPFNERYLWD